MKYHVINNECVYLLKNEENITIAQGRSIGINNINGFNFSDSFSSYDNVIQDYDRIYMGNSMEEQRMITIGNIDDAYKMLSEILKKNSDKTFVDICTSVLETIHFYFGGYTHLKERFSYFPTEEKVSTGVIARGKISDIKGKGVARGEERAILSQNLLKSLKINSLIKFSMVKIIDEQKEREFVHAYNLIENDGKYYLFDTTFPTIYNGRMSPIIMELDKGTFENLAYPLNDNKDLLNSSVSSYHFDPLSVQFINVTYNCSQEKVK